MNTSRIHYIDNMRAICCVWIIGLWHMMAYCPLIDFGQNSEKGVVFTTAILALFMFFSGYFNGKAKLSYKDEILAFYKKKIIRIYPSLILACLGFYYLIGYIGKPINIIQILTGSEWLFSKLTSTLWFITVLIFYIVMTPVVLSKSENNAKWIWRLSAIVISLIVLRELNPNMDVRVITYIPAYSLGIAASRGGGNLEDIVRISKRNVIIEAVFLASYLIVTVFLSDVGHWLVIAAGTMVKYLFVGYLILLITYNIPFFRYNIGIMNHIAYASLNAYMYHRIIYGGARKLLGCDFSIPVAICLVFATIFVSWIMQKITDHCFDRKRKA